MTRAGLSRGAVRAGAFAIVLLATPTVIEAAPPSEPSTPIDRPAPAHLVVSVDARPRSDAVHARLQGRTSLPVSEGEGIAVLEVHDLPMASAWAFAAAFSTAVPEAQDALWLGPAPAPGSGVDLGADARVHAIVVTRVDASGTGSPPWPADPDSLTPLGSSARSADLTVASAPLFAAPAPVVPAASESHAMLPRRADVWTLGRVDRCRDDATTRRCLHWAQVVARDGDRFVFGYLPAMWLADREGWVPGPRARPRAQLVRSGRAGDDAQLVLLAREADGTLHRRLVTLPAASERWPAATLAVKGASATIAVDGTPAITLPIDASLDARPDDL